MITDTITLSVNSSGGGGGGNPLAAGYVTGTTIKDQQNRASDGVFLEVVAKDGSSLNENLQAKYTYINADPNATWTLTRPNGLSTLYKTGKDVTFNDGLVAWSSSQIFLKNVSPRNYTISVAGFSQTV